MLVCPPVKLEASSHPIGVISRLCEIGGPLAFEFSRYSYEPRAIEDQRRTFRVDFADVPMWVEKTILELKENEDLAFHSRVYLRNEIIRHIPMIDFVGRPSGSELAQVKEALHSFGIKEVALFDSGRSYHLYGLALISHEEWLRFLGRILLLNLPGQGDVVDGRWVGHRLMAGYGTLRWTKNNTRYQALPTRIKENSLL